VPTVPATKEAEAGRPLEPGNLRSTWQHRQTLSQKQRKKIERNKIYQRNRFNRELVLILSKDSLQICLTLDCILAVF
jgi:hypothetical protein